ncbi:MAG: hypothetical protein LBS83_03670 [Holosporales bacterium]|jgi:hypothetical protein|nr:hypothetical protein [Holosporales bacterium]
MNAGLSMYYASTKVPVGPPAGVAANILAGPVETHVLQTANNLLGAQIPAVIPGPGAVAGGGYGCCEGQIVARLFDTNPPVDPAAPGTLLQPLFPQVIRNLLTEAEVQRVAAGQANPITGADIVLVVLHIHSHQDPCAKCSKVLSGLSRQMNMPEHDPANPNTTQTPAMTTLLNNWAGVGLNPVPVNIRIPGLIENLHDGDAKFLIEVSSDVPYSFNLGGGIRACSHAEVAGQDGNGATPINVNIGGGPINFAGPAGPAVPVAAGGAVGPHQLAILGGTFFPATFPPYVVYGRVVAGGGIAAPANPCGVPVLAHVAAAGNLGQVP